jgi:hypothetical protein
MNNRSNPVAFHSLVAVRLLALVLASVWLGYAASGHGRVAAAALVGGFAVTVVFVTVGIERFTTGVLALLPWFVLLIDVTPKLSLTLTAAAAVALLLILTPLRREVTGQAWLAAWLFAAIILADAVGSSHGSRFIEAAKYSLFPAMALVVSSPTMRARLIDMRSTLLVSGVAALAADGLAILLHVGKVGGYYGVGEQLGLAAESPHEIALIGVTVAIACLLVIRDIRWRLAGAAVASIPALATGVRSALLALVLSVVVLTLRARFRPSVVLSIAAVALAIVVSGVGSIVLARFDQSIAQGQYTSFSNVGSDRGAVWQTAIRYWDRGGPVGIVFGGGLRSIQYIEKTYFGEAVSAQSDAVAVLVELGIFGLVTWILLWVTLMRSGIEWLILVPLGSYAVSNGSLEYVGAVVFGIALAAACGRQSNELSSTRKLDAFEHLEPYPFDSSQRVAIDVLAPAAEGLSDASRIATATGSERYGRSARPGWTHGDPRPPARAQSTSALIAATAAGLLVVLKRRSDRRRRS